MGEDRGWEGKGRGGRKGKAGGERKPGGEKEGIRREGINLPHGRLKTSAALRTLHAE